MSTQDIFDELANMRKEDGDAPAPGASDSKYPPDAFHQLAARVANTVAEHKRKDVK